MELLFAAVILYFFLLGTSWIWTKRLIESLLSAVEKIYNKQDYDEEKRQAVKSLFMIVLAIFVAGFFSLGAIH